MVMTYCPECEEPIEFGASPHAGQRVSCTNCDATLVVTSLRPLELDSVYDNLLDEPDEDWDDDHEFDQDWEEDWEEDSTTDEEWGLEEDWDEDLETERSWDEG